MQDNACANHVASVLENIEAAAHVQLHSKVVDFVELQVIGQLHHLDRIRQVAIMKK